MGQMKKTAVGSFKDDGKHGVRECEMDIILFIFTAIFS